MPNIIRDRDAVRGAPMEDLNHTYRALKGEPNHPGFSTRAAAEIQVGMAILSAEYDTGKAGVPKGTKPKALTPEELNHSNPYKEGTMSHALKEAVDKQQPIAPRPKASEKAPSERAGRLVIKRVQATNAGTSRPQAGSIRNQVLLFIQAAPEGICTVAELEEHFKQPVRGYLQKLVEKNHLLILEDS